MASTPSPDDYSKRLPRPPFPWRAWLAALVVIAILAWSAAGTASSAADFFTGLPQMGLYFKRLTPWGVGWPWGYLPRVSGALLETIKLSLASTSIGAVLALLFALVGSRPLAGSPLAYGFWRAILNLIRTVPDLVMASLAVAAFGLGALPGWVALVIFSFGVIAKLLSDTIETADTGTLEAITAVGGTRLQKGLFAMLPQIAPDYVAYSLYAFEINIRVAVVLGLVGAGGIGQILYRDITLLRYGHVGLIIAVTFVVVMLTDWLSTYWRSRLV
jgi:phosphonate transport system permease protein